MEFFKKIFLFLFSLFGSIWLDINKFCRFTFLRNFKKKSTPQETLNLLKNGYAELPGNINSDLCHGIKSKIEGVIDSHLNGNNIPEGVSLEVRDRESKLGIDTGMIHLYNPEFISDEIHFLKKDLNIKKILQEVTGKRIYLKNFYVYQNRGITETRQFHFDQCYKWQFKAFLLLTDVAELNDGPFTILQGTSGFNREKYLSLFKSIPKIFTEKKEDYHRSLTTINVSSKKHPKNFFGKIGSLIIADQNCYHRGWPQEKGKYRLMLVADFYSTS